MSIVVRSPAHQWALVGVFSAFQVITTIIPYSISVGVEGTISVGLISAPLIGVLLGPVLGTIAVVIGSVLGIMINPVAGVMWYFTPIATASGAFVAGAIRTGRSMLVAPVFLAGLVAFLVGPVGYLSLSYVWLHCITLLPVAALMVPAVGRSMKSYLEQVSSLPRLTIAVTLLSFVAVMTDHIVGSAIAAFYFVYMVGFDAAGMAAAFNTVSLLYPLERIVATIILTVVTVALFTAARSSVLLIDEGNDLAAAE
ncbi:MAG: hypothetical protein ACP6IT_03910 [Candidatus Thorarchaeota archaeon]